MNHCPSPPLSYRILSWPLFVIGIGHALLHVFRSGDIRYLWQRLSISRSSHATVWMHAASVGEVELLKPLLIHVSDSQPVLLTVFTVTGYQHALNTLPRQIQVRVIPIDFIGTAWLFFRRHRIKLGLIAETELWPETLYRACSNQIPLIHLNARLSSKSLNQPAWIRRILQITLSYFSQHLTRTETDFDNLCSLSVSPEKVVICGNLKHARPVSSKREHLENLIQRPYLLLASSHYPEELLLTEVVNELQQAWAEKHPALNLLVIAPRHPKRAAEILRALSKTGLSIKQRSSAQTIEQDTRIYLADTLGELKQLFAHASLVIMGGSFNDVGGHNILEPAQLGRAIITGPSDSNIKADISLLSEHQAIIQVQDRQQLKQQITALLDSGSLREALEQNALAVTSKQQHIFQAYLQALQPFLDQLDS